MFAYCGNGPISRTDYSGYVHDETTDGSRFVGAGIQIELDVGPGTAGVEFIVYWDVKECGDNGIVIAAYSYGGGSLNFSAQQLASLEDALIQNFDLLKGGTGDPISRLKNIIATECSVSASVVAIYGNEEFTSVNSYEGPFVAVSGNASHIKGSVAFSNTCVAVSLGGTTANTLGGGFTATDYTLCGTVYIGKTQPYQMYRSYLGM